MYYVHAILISPSSFCFSWLWYCCNVLHFLHAQSMILLLYMQPYIISPHLTRLHKVRRPLTHARKQISSCGVCLERAHWKNTVFIHGCWSLRCRQVFVTTTRPPLEVSFHGRWRLVQAVLFGISVLIICLPGFCFWFSFFFLSLFCWWPGWKCIDLCLIEIFFTNKT